MPIERTEPTLRLSSAKPNIAKRLLSALLLALMLVSLVTPVLAGTGTEAYVNLDDVNVRTGAGTQHATVKFSGSGIMLNKGHYVRIIATQKDTAGWDWYQIVFTYRGYTKVGFMRSDFVSVLGDDAEYAAYLDEQGFPKSYQPYLRALHAASGGKWNFVANQTGLDWGRALENESTLGRALIDGSNTALRSTAPGAYDSSTGVWRQYESGWYAANEKTVAYYLDPRSYLTDGSCITFQLLSGGTADATHEQVKQVLRDCVWATDEIIDEFVRAGSKEELAKERQREIDKLTEEINALPDGTEKNRKIASRRELEGLKDIGVSAIFLAVKARGEIGTKATANATGYTLNAEDGGGTYFNFFNIGAYGSPNPNYNGIKYARDKGWDTSYKALLGGAFFLSKNYIAKGQDTQYLQRFNLTSTSTFSHQYATDIAYAYKGGRSTYNSYVKNGLLDVPLTLSVPILENMPTVTKLPTAVYEDEYEPDPDPTPEPTPDPEPEPDPEPPKSYDYVSELDLRLTDGYLSGFTLGTPVKSLVSQIKAVNKDAAVTVTDSKGAAAADTALVGTGQTLTIRDASGTMTYICLVYGDADGDGRIAATDLLAVKMHILNMKTLTGASARALTFSGDGKIAATSLLAVKKHILGMGAITQK